MDVATASVFIDCQYGAVLIVNDKYKIKRSDINDQVCHKTEMKIHVICFLQILSFVFARSWNTFVSFPTEHSTSHVVSTRTYTEDGSRSHKSFFESFDTKLDSPRHTGFKSHNEAGYVNQPATVSFHHSFGLSSPLQGSLIFAMIISHSQHIDIQVLSVKL